MLGYTIILNSEFRKITLFILIFDDEVKYQFEIKKFKSI
jgi:hypothetical protein